ncbi:hypothetical protein M885DRAFT_617347, partial [Pelagophyceae sp. CCMP2097]
RKSDLAGSRSPRRRDGSAVLHGGVPRLADRRRFPVDQCCKVVVPRFRLYPGSALPRRRPAVPAAPGALRRGPAVPGDDFVDGAAGPAAPRLHGRLAHGLVESDPALLRTTHKRLLSFGVVPIADALRGLRGHGPRARWLFRESELSPPRRRGPVHTRPRRCRILARSTRRLRPGLPRLALYVLRLHRLLQALPKNAQTRAAAGVDKRPPPPRAREDATAPSRRDPRRRTCRNGGRVRDFPLFHHRPRHGVRRELTLLRLFKATTSAP